MRISKIFKNLFLNFKKAEKFFLDTLFPIKCLVCQQEGTWLCSDCWEKLPRLREQTCPFCEKNPTPSGRVCFACRVISPLDGMVVAAPYHEETTAKLIHRFKYNFVTELSRPLGQLLVNAYIDSDFPVPHLIVPIPLHRRRLRWRGFNQAALLARELASGITPGYIIDLNETLLVRQRFTQAQMKISNHKKRKKNIQGVFKIITNSLNPKSGLDLKSKTILLVDDVATTGATLFECARILKENGAREVLAIVIARQETKRI